MQFPNAAKRYSQAGTSIGGTMDGQRDSGDHDAAKTFAFEHPSLTDYEALEPTSGKKAWMLKHGKRIKKKLKADKRGFIGGTN